MPEEDRLLGIENDTDIIYEAATRRIVRWTDSAADCSTCSKQQALANSTLYRKIPVVIAINMKTRFHIALFLTS